MNKKRIVSLGLATSIMLSSAAAFADIGDIYKKPDYTKVYYEAVDVMKDEDVQLELMKNPEKYAFEGKDRKAYDYVDANKEFVKDNDGFVDNLGEDYDGVDLEEDQELVVESVSAINQTVNKSATLKFKINGEKEVTAADIKEAGYKVAFKASEAVFAGDSATSETGVLAIGTVKKDHKFKYEVEVKDKDGKAVEVIGGFAEVTVEDQAKMVTEITKVEVSVNDKVLSETEVYPLAAKETAIIKVLGRTKNLTEKDKDVELTSTDLDLVKFEVEPTTLGSMTKNEFTATEGVKGEVTVKFVAGEEKGQVKFSIGNEERKVDAKASKVSEDKLEVAAGKTAKFTVELVDQYGEPVAADDITNINVENVKTDAKVVKSAKFGPVKEDGKEVAGKYEVTITAESKKAVGEAKIVVDGVTLDQKINITVKEAGEATKVDLEASAENFDLSKDAEIITITGKALDDKGLEVALADDSNLKIELKLKENDKFTFNEDTGELAVKDSTKVTTEDKAVVEAKLLEGEITLDTKEITVGVVDTTPKIASAELKDGAKAITESTDNLDLSDYIEIKSEDDKELSIEVVEDGKVLVKADTKELGHIVVKSDNKDFVVEVTTNNIKVTLPKIMEEDQKANLLVLVVGKDQKPVGDEIKIPMLVKTEDIKDEKGYTTEEIVKKKALEDEVLGVDQTVEDLKVRMKNTEGSDELLTLEEFQLEMSKIYDVDFQIGNLKIKEGNLVITGELLSTEDWIKVKTRGTDGKIKDQDDIKFNTPYRISIMKQDATKPNEDAAFRIAMYGDGTATIVEESSAKTK